jgi:hypothetical protein
VYFLPCGAHAAGGGGLSNDRVRGGRIANVLAGWLTGPVLSVCGRSGITYLGNALQTLSFIGTGMARSGPTLIGALALRAPVNENSAVQAMLAAAAKRNDIGQGRLAADVANFAAVTKVFTPILYSYTAQNGSTSQPFYVAAFLFFVCNVVFAMVASNEALPLTRSWARLRDAVPGPGALFCPVASLPAFVFLSLLCACEGVRVRAGPRHRHSVCVISLCRTLSVVKMCSPSLATQREHCGPIRGSRAEWSAAVRLAGFRRRMSSLSLSGQMDMGEQ